LVLGVALALLAFLAMLAFGLLFTRGVANAGEVRLVVAARDIQPREPITLDMITIATAPSSSAATAFVHVSDLNGFAAVVPIFKGEVVTRNLVSSNPDDITGAISSYLPIPAGYVAMTLPTSEQQGVAGYVAQGDYIDILATVNTSLFARGNERQVTRTVFTNIHVIRVGPASTLPKQGQPQGVSSSLTVVLSLCDAQYMDWLITNTTLKYTLLSFHDYAPSVAPADPNCPATLAPNVIGPAFVDARWAFSKG
jgi:Flp pilus assembly protein CpaB